MSSNTLLLAVIFLPLATACLLPLLAAAGRRGVRAAALAATLLTLAGAVVLTLRFPADGEVGAGFAVTDVPWLSDAGFDVRLSFGLDGLGLWLFDLTALLMVTSVLVSWRAVKDRPALFYGLLLTLETGCLGVFAARDLILFYVFFEFTLAPLFFLIGIWGSEERRYAAVKFFVFTLAGSLLTFLGLLAIVVLTATQATDRLTFSIPELTAALSARPSPLPLAWQLGIFVALWAGFAIKAPLFPLHTWLPLAHVQAPTAGSVLLAGVLLKIGAYGFLRLSLPLLPDAAALATPVLLGLCVAGILYGALTSLAQTDIKKLIAYSSVSHLGFCLLGVFAANRLGLQGGALQLVNHGLSTGALFALVGMVYERYHTRRIADLGGLAVTAPWLAFFMVFFTFSSIGVPGLNGFAGEFLLLTGMFQRAFEPGPAPACWWLQALAVLSVLGVVLGAWYSLWLVQRVFFGPLRTPSAHAPDGAHESHPLPPDLTGREIAALAPLAVACLWIGLWPGYFLTRLAPALEAPRQAMQAALESEAETAAPTLTQAENQSAR